LHAKITMNMIESIAKVPHLTICLSLHPVSTATSSQTIFLPRIGGNIGRIVLIGRCLSFFFFIFLAFSVLFFGGVHAAGLGIGGNINEWGGDGIPSNKKKKGRD